MIMLMMLLAFGNGCMRRRITVRSNPPGARVFIDDQDVGTTPVSTYVTYYGTRKIQLVKDRYRTITKNHTFNAPWYQIPPLDFFSVLGGRGNKKLSEFQNFLDDKF